MKSLAITFLLARAVSPALGAGFTLGDPGTFSVEEAAGGALAHDIYTLTLDGKGRVVVSGPGYIRLLEDPDGDGRFDAARDFHRGPANGCQGMVFHGRALYTVGGAGIERYLDLDEDGVADGPPELLLRLGMAGEHGPHAVRVGPDGL
ncbi:MAG TPA: hypothetical protein VMT52_14595, partial [Planctomycetota bacterium]|nr:hypothetical protein [Planctomycetota bacterium]